MRKVPKEDIFFTLYGFMKGIRERSEDVRTTMCGVANEEEKEDRWNNKRASCREAMSTIEEMQDLLNRSKLVVRYYMKKVGKKKK